MRADLQRIDVNGFVVHVLVFSPRFNLFYQRSFLKLEKGHFILHCETLLAGFKTRAAKSILFSVISSGFLKRSAH